MKKFVTVSYSVEVPKEDWIDFLLKSSDIFRSDYCGYWLRGIEYSAETKSKLVWEDDELHRFGAEPNLALALEAR